MLLLDEFAANARYKQQTAADGAADGTDVEARARRRSSALPCTASLGTCQRRTLTRCHRARCSRRWTTETGCERLEVFVSVHAPNCTLSICGVQTPLMTTAPPRQVLTELLKQHGWTCCPREWQTGPTHQPTHHVTLRLVHTESGSALECSGNGPTKDAALDAAAELALDAVEPDWRALRPATTEREVHRAEALVGDAVLDLLLALLAQARGLQVKSIDALRQRTLSNYALGGGAAGTARATAVEAAIGRAALQCGLEQVLRDSLIGAGQGALLHDIEEAVEREKAIEPEAVSKLLAAQPS